MIAQIIRAHRLARLGAADLDHVSARLFFTEIMIKTGNPVDFRPAEIELLGNGLKGTFGNKAKFFLHFMQNRQKRPFKSGQTITNGTNPDGYFLGRLCCRHASLSHLAVY